MLNKLVDHWLSYINHLVLDYNKWSNILILEKRMINKMISDFLSLNKRLVSDYDKLNSIWFFILDEYLTN